MSAICFYFQVHQPRRVKRYRAFDIGHTREYFNEEGENNRNNRKILEKVANKCYVPANYTLYDMLQKHPEFRFAFSFSGVFLDQLEEYAPHVLESFRKLIATGRVEVLSETYHHSLAFLYSKDEFRRQIELHRKKVKQLFGVSPRVFRNTELIYSDEIGQEAEKMGFDGILAEGADHILEWRSPNFLYRPKDSKHIKLLLKNYKLSDDIAFRFSSRSWSEWPLTAEKFAHWVSAHNGNGDVVNLFMDYETFGEHQWEDTGIFEFLRALPGELGKHPDNYFVTPSEAVKKFRAYDELSVPHYVSWADIERDISAWRGNPIQHDALRALYALEGEALQSGDKKLIEDWRRLQTSDHFYYMCTKWFADGDVHKYFNPYDSPYDAFISYMNVLHDMRLRIDEALAHRHVVSISPTQARVAVSRR